MEKKHLFLGGAAVLLVLVTLLLVYLGTITFEQAMYGGPLLVSMTFGIYQWKEKVSYKNKYEHMQEHAIDLEYRNVQLRKKADKR